MCGDGEMLSSTPYAGISLLIACQFESTGKSSHRTPDVVLHSAMLH